MEAPVVAAIVVCAAAAAVCKTRSDRANWPVAAGGDAPGLPTSACCGDAVMGAHCAWSDSVSHSATDARTRCEATVRPIALCAHRTRSALRSSRE